MEIIYRTVMFLGSRWNYFWKVSEVVDAVGNGDAFVSYKLV